MIELIKFLAFALVALLLIYLIVLMIMFGWAIVKTIQKYIHKNMRRR